MNEKMWLDGNIPVIVMEHDIETLNTKVFNEDTGRWWWVYTARLAPQPRGAETAVVYCDECGDAPAVERDGWICCGNCGARICPAGEA